MDVSSCHVGGFFLHCPVPDLHAPLWDGSCPRNAAIQILPLLVCAVVHEEGKNSRPFVFTVHSQNFSSQPVQSLDVSADSLEELNLWATKIREAAQNADARVRTRHTPPPCMRSSISWTKPQS